MEAIIKEIGSWLLWGASITTACVAIYNSICKPVKELQKDIKELKEDVSLSKDDICDILRDTLTQGHDKWVEKGYCPRHEKERLIEVHTRYTLTGRNHLADTFVKDLTELQEHPPE